MASSFVGTVLEHAGHLEQRAVHEKMDTLIMKLSEMEVEVYQLAESKYINFRPNLETAEGLLQRVQDAENEISTLQRKITTEIKDQLSLSTGDFSSLYQELSEAKTILTGLTYLTDIYNMLETSAMSLEEKKYSQAALTLQKLGAYFRHPLCDKDDKIAILVAMKTELKVQTARLECELSDLWKDVFKLSVTGHDGAAPQPGNGASIKEISVSVTCEGESTSHLKQLISGLHVSNLLDSRIKNLADFFHKYLLPFVVEAPDLTMEVKASHQTKTLYISYENMKLCATKNKGTSKNVDEGKMYVYVFGNLMNILENLRSLILDIEYECEDSSDLYMLSSASVSQSKASSGSKNGTLMSLLGQAVSPWLLDFLQKSVLAKAVPTSAKDLEGFNEVIAATRYLQDELLKLGFIQPENRSLLNYVQNVNMLFANKKSQITLEEARRLMTSDLHDTVAVTEDKPVGEWPPLARGGVEKSKQIQTSCEQQLGDNTFRLPKCRISANVQELMKLAYETLSEATDSSPECALQMFYAVRNMFELFSHVVPTHHAHNFEMFPQIAALHHNNCMFISHHLMTLGHQFASKLPAPESKSFVDLIENIRRSGVSVFMSQLMKQRGLLLEYLDGANGFANVEVESNFEKVNKSIRQAMLQLGHVQKVWKPVLPVSIYKKAIGKLIEGVVERLVDCITSLEDIAQDAGHRLVDLLSLVEERCAELIVSPGEVASAELARYVHSWSQLTELKFVLGASLSGIADRWAEGMGPLAASFTPAEVKQLVRALFQNTERRSNLLSAIK